MSECASRPREVLPSDRTSPAGFRSAYCKEEYFVPGFQPVSENLAPTDGLEPLEEVDPAGYYGGGEARVDARLRVPSNLAASLDRFFALPPQEQERYLRACHWFQHAQSVFSLSRSASYLALIGAVEVLIPKEQSPPTCGTCGRNIGKGPTALFRDFLEAHAPTAAGGTAKGRKRLYEMRSALTHGGTLLEADLDLDLAWGATGMEQGEIFHSAWRATRVALVGWLHAHDGVTPDSALVGPAP